mmetsp:Transcript_19598/g.28934  ORF Transcript_19598/g.28934 Transcript_19598/m.28934 type:complete len:354 (-) Transcript_19598:412-1473(-)
MLCTKLGDKLGGIISSIVCNDRGHLTECLSECRHCNGLLTGCIFNLAVDCQCHEDFSTSSSVNPARILDSSLQDTKSIMQRSLSFIQKMRGRSSQDNRTRCSRLAPSKTDNLILSNHDFFHNVTFAEGDQLGMLKGTCNLTTSNGSKTLNSIEIGMFNGHNTVLSKDGLGKVVNELTVNENVCSMSNNLLTLLTHLVLLCLFNLRHLIHGINLDTTSINFDLISIHGRIGNKDLGILYALWLSNTNLLIHQKTIFKVGIFQLSSSLFEDLDMIQIIRSLQSHDRVDGQGCKVSLFMRQQFGRKSGSSNPHQVSTEQVIILTIIDSTVFQCLFGKISGDSPSSSNGLRVDPLID